MNLFVAISPPSWIECLIPRAVKRAAFAALTLIFAVVGIIVGLAAGAVIGQTKEIGCIDGARMGAFTGAVISMEMLEATIGGGQWSLMQILLRLVDGRAFHEWVGEALMAAHEQEFSFADYLTEFDFDSTKGMPSDSLKRLPEFVISSQEKIKASGKEMPCAVCLQDFDEGDIARSLPRCGHHFHLICIDKWLLIHGSCPICRKAVG